jgi:C-terminal processing protease CtpA/Prc
VGSRHLGDPRRCARVRDADPENGPLSTRALPLALLPLLAAGCGITRTTTPTELPPLADLEEPALHLTEPDDEVERLALDAGSFTGVRVGDSRQTLAALAGEPEGLLVEAVVENSPAQAAGVEPGDLIFEVDAGSGVRELAWPSEWRELELETPPGAEWSLLVDRAGAELELGLTSVPRVAHPPRVETTRYREEERVGLVVRTATEAEARAAGLGPGGGAVVVGLSRRSPWRGVGVTFEDLVFSVDGEAVSHPQVLLDAIRAVDPDDELTLGVRRGGEDVVVAAPVTRRTSSTQLVSIPLIYFYENDGATRTSSAIIGLYKHVRTSAAWRMRLLWFIRFGGGDEDRLEELDA